MVRPSVQALLIYWIKQLISHNYFSKLVLMGLLNRQSIKSHWSIEPHHWSFGQFRGGTDELRILLSPPPAGKRIVRGDEPAPGGRMSISDWLATTLSQNTRSWLNRSALSSSRSERTCLLSLFSLQLLTRPTVTQNMGLFVVSVGSGSFVRLKSQGQFSYEAIVSQAPLLKLVVIFCCYYPPRRSLCFANF